MRLIGYGEDGLTAWAFDRKLPQVLTLLNDNSQVEKCLVFYRPSCGRRGGTQFGEFDAILASQEAVYLFENKWDGSAIRIVEGRIILEERQIRRHSTFQNLRNLWQQHRPGNWHDFTAHWQAAGLGGQLSRPNTRLAKNLSTLLVTLQDCPNATKNVLLYFHRQGARTLEGIEPPDQFTLFQLTYPTIGNSLFFDFDAPLPLP
jgi:hypothetical protein